MGWPATLLATAQSGDWARAHLWKITRSDGNIFGFTDRDIDLKYDNGDGDGEITYKASTGFINSPIDKTADGAIDNLQALGLYGTVDLEDIQKTELFEGRFEGATLKIMLVDAEDRDATDVITAGEDYELFHGQIGNIIDKGQYFEAEIIGDDRKLNQYVGRIIQPLCDAVLFDSRCGLTEATFTHSGTVDGVTDNSTFTDTATAGIADQDDDYFGAGKITWTSGNNDGLSAWVKSFISDEFILYKAMPNDIQAGDTFDAVAGCRKRVTEDCDTKFNNIANHRGFPGVPGDKFILTYAD